MSTPFPFIRAAGWGRRCSTIFNLIGIYHPTDISGFEFDGRCGTRKLRIKWNCRYNFEVVWVEVEKAWKINGLKPTYRKWWASSLPGPRTARRSYNFAIKLLCWYRSKKRTRKIKFSEIGIVKKKLTKKAATFVLDTTASNNMTKIFTRCATDSDMKLKPVFGRNTSFGILCRTKTINVGDLEDGPSFREFLGAKLQSILPKGPKPSNSMYMNR